MSTQLHKRSNEKGSLTELAKGSFAQCNLLSMKKDTMWGGHYHKKTTEHFCIIEGTIHVITKHMKTGETSEQQYSAGDSFAVLPYTFHTVKIIADATCVVLYSHEFDASAPDIYV